MGEVPLEDDGAGIVPRSIARPNQHDPGHACDRITHDRINSFHCSNAFADTRAPPPDPGGVELGCFALAAVALIAAGATVAGIAYAVVAAVNAVLLAAFGQLEA